MTAVALLSCTLAPKQMTYLRNAAMPEARQTASHESARAAGLHDGRNNQVVSTKVERLLIWRAGMEWFTGILHEATARIAPGYFLLPVHGGPSVYRERVYCYELYHQMRLLWPGDCPYRLNGEVDKRAHPYFREGGEPKPDLLVHEPGSGNNYCVVEVKSCRASDAGIEKDIETLARFTTEIGYPRAIYLIYGEEAAELITTIEKHAAAVHAPIEVWLHPAPGQPAHCINH